MLNIGDKVFYPVFGAGVIAEIEEKNFHGVNGKYYMIKLVKNSMLVMIPEKDVNNKIRKAVSEEEVFNIMRAFKETGVNLPEKWNKRVRIYNEAIREGDIFKMALAIKNIAFLSQTKKLSKSEKNFFYTLLGYVSDEIALVLSKDADEIYNIILSSLNFNEELS